MISRRLLLLDRLAATLLAVALLAAAVVGAWWWAGLSPLQDTTNTASTLRVVERSWFPWVTAIIGLALIVLGLRWIVAHIRTTKVNELYLHGSGATGKLLVDGSKVADAAATALQGTLGVAGARGSVRRTRGQVVATIHAKIEPEADLALIAENADLISSQLAQALGRQDLRCSVQLRVARRGGTLPRVS